MSAIGAIVQLDTRGILRDNVMFINIGLSIFTVIVITSLGLFQEHLPGWRQWYPFMVAMSLVSGPGGFGYLLGLLVVDEGDTGVRRALSVTPVPPRTLILTRTLVAFMWLCIWPVVTLSVMNAAWQVLDLSVANWAALIISLALLAPVFVLAIPLFAQDKVGALAVFKGLTFCCLIPLALYFVDADALYRVVFLVFPTAWTINAFDAFVDGSTAGYWWAVGAGLFNLILLVGCVQLFQRRIYQTHN